VTCDIALASPDLELAIDIRNAPLNEGNPAAIIEGVDVSISWYWPPERQAGISQFVVIANGSWVQYSFHSQPAMPSPQSILIFGYTSGWRTEDRLFGGDASVAEDSLCLRLILSICSIFSTRPARGRPGPA
jgi:hypothetical protein